jgi:hypothetical protein
MAPLLSNVSKELLACEAAVTCKTTRRHNQEVLARCNSSTPEIPHLVLCMKYVDLALYILLYCNEIVIYKVLRINQLSLIITLSFIH